MKIPTLYDQALFTANALRNLAREMRTCPDQPPPEYDAKTLEEHAADLERAAAASKEAGQ